MPRRLCSHLIIFAMLLLSVRRCAGFVTTALAHRPMVGSKLFLTTNILVVGKRNAGEDWINEGCKQYETRLTNSLTVVTHYLKSDSDLVDAVFDGKKTSLVRGALIALDENGTEFTSRKFSDFLYDSLVAGGAHCTFIIGGFDGLPSQIQSSKDITKISLSKMTWTHQMARLLLLEQIYRGMEIKKGSAYHKD